MDESRPSFAPHGPATLYLFLARAMSSCFRYIGADNDVGASQWYDLSVWGIPAWDVVGPSPAPTEAAPTPAPALPAFTDEFLAFDPLLWLAQCEGCTYAGGSLVVTGDSQLLRSRGTFVGLSRVTATLTKNDERDDHGLVFSVLSA